MEFQDYENADGEITTSAEAQREKAAADFMSALRRERTPTTEAMQKGIDFENMVTRLENGEPCDKLPNWGKWGGAAAMIADIVRGGILQASFSEPATINGLDVLLYGRLDALKAGIIYDIKFSGVYTPGKFLGSPQHPLYFAVVPEAAGFEYLIFKPGEGVYRERYRRADAQDISITVGAFIDYLGDSGLMALYREQWGTRQ
jgi:hypothetical protein